MVAAPGRPVAGKSRGGRSVWLHLSAQRGGRHSVKEECLWGLVTTHGQSLLLEQEAGERGSQLQWVRSRPRQDRPGQRPERLLRAVAPMTEVRREHRVHHVASSLTVISVVALSVNSQCLLSSPSQMTE